MNIDQEINNIKDIVPEERKWLKEPYAGAIQIKSIEYSENVKDGNGKPYTGSPFFKFIIATKLGDLSSITFWREVPGADPEKNKNKKEKLKTFLKNARVNDTLEGQAWLESVIGNKLNVVLKVIEKWIEPKDAPPKIINEIIYSYSLDISENFTTPDLNSLIIRLDDAELKKFREASERFNAAHPAEEKKDAVSESQSNFEAGTTQEESPQQTEKPNTEGTAPESNATSEGANPEDDLPF